MLTRQDGISHPHPQYGQWQLHMRPTNNMLVTRVTLLVSIHDYVILYTRKHDMKNLH